MRRDTAAELLMAVSDAPFEGCRRMLVTITSDLPHITYREFVPDTVEGAEASAIAEASARFWAEEWGERQSQVRWTWRWE